MADFSRIIRIFAEDIRFARFTLLCKEKGFQPLKSNTPFSHTAIPISQYIRFINSILPHCLFSPSGAKRV